MAARGVMMTALNGQNRRIVAGLALLITLQVICAAYFLYDILHDLADLGDVVALWMEIAAVGLLVASVIIEGVVLSTLMRRQLHLEKGLSVAAGALSELMNTYFSAWGLTASEQDVATFAIKGYSIAEIANLRGSSEGTIKTHLNAIYRKADVPGRAQLVSVLVEDLLRAPIVKPSATR